MKKFAYVLIGIAIPVILYWLGRKDFLRQADRQHLDELQEIAVEDSFPASDPPASW